MPSYPSVKEALRANAKTLLLAKRDGGKSSSSKSSKSSGSKSGSKKDKSGYIPRDLLKEGRDGLQLMREAYPAILEMNRMYGGQFAVLDAEISGKRLGAETKVINEQYPGFREAMLKSPEIAKANDAMQARLDETGASEIEHHLVSDAESDLDLGGQMSADEMRNVQQASRSATSARGLGTGSSAAIAEVFDRDTAMHARKRERQAFAANVDTQVQQRKASDASITANVGQAQMAYWDPQGRMFGKGGGSASLGAVNNLGSFGPFLGAAQNVGASNQASKLDWTKFQQGLDWDKEAFAQNMDFSRWATQYNAQQSAQNARATNKSNMWGAALGAVGSIAGAFLM